MKSLRKSLFGIVLTASFLLLVMSLQVLAVHADTGNIGCTWSSDVNVTSRTTISDRVVVDGNVTLTIAEGVTLTCKKGISVRSGNSLTINGPGTLKSNTMYEDDEEMGPYAGIGGDPTNPNAGTIVINSGVVVAQAGKTSAAIGGGAGGSGGTITINDGNVTANGNDEGAHIGAGQDNGDYDVTINGGIITITKSYASGFNGAAAIGAGGPSAPGGDPAYANGTIRLYGGQVNIRQGHMGSGTVRREGSNIIELSWTKPDDYFQFPDCVFSNNIKYLKPFFDQNGNLINPGTYKGSGRAYEHYGTRTPAVKTINYYKTPDELYKTQKVQINTATTAPADAPTWEKSKSFRGWYTSWHDAEEGDHAEDATDLFDFSTPINQDINLYAGWNRKCTLVLGPGEGTDGASTKHIDVLYGGEYTLPDPAGEDLGFSPLPGKKFSGWKYGSGDHEGEYAGNIGDTITIEGDSIKKFDVLNLSSLASDYYDVVYRPNFGTGSEKRFSVIKDGSHTLLDNKDLPDGGFTAPAHKEFDGWNVEINYKSQGKMEPGTEITVTGTVHAYAQWKQIRHTVTFVDEDGETVLKPAIEYDEGDPAVAINKPADPYKEPDAQYTYTFAGWEPEITEVTKDAMYKATYSKKLNQYTVKWVNEDGMEFASKTLEYGSVIPEYSGETPEKAGTPEYSHTFDKWVTEQAIGETVTGDITFKATYTTTKNKYEIRFVNEDGTELQKSEVEYGAMPEYTGETPTKKADEQYTYNFAGWDKELAAVTKAATYTATYSKTENSHTIPSGDGNPNQKGKDGTAVGPGASAAAADKAITSSKSEEGPKGTKFAPVSLRSTKQGKTNINLTWKKVKGAKSYVVYGNACGKKNKMKKIATVKTNKYNVKKAGKKLKKGTYYKLIVVALDSNRNVVSTSKVVHVATKGGKVTNYRGVSIKKSVINKAGKLKVGKTLKLQAKQIKQGKGKVRVHRALCYETSNAKIATVSKKGVVKGKAKGSCYITAYTQSGTYKRIKVTVK